MQDRPSHPEDDRIDRYVCGQMTPQEQADFEELLRSDTTLRAETAFRQELREGIANVTEQQWKDELKHLPLDKPAIPMWQTTWFRIAASLFLVLGVGWGLFHLTSKPDPHQLYADNFKPYPNILAPVERDSNNAAHPLDQAMLQYQHGNFEQAKQQLKKLAISEDDSRVSFYYAQTLMATDDLAAAKAILEQILDGHATPDLALQMHWYLALCYLELEELPRCREELEQLTQGNSPYATKAKKLLSQLDG